MRRSLRVAQHELVGRGGSEWSPVGIAGVDEPARNLGEGCDRDDLQLLPVTYSPRGPRVALIGDLVKRDVGPSLSAFRLFGYTGQVVLCDEIVGIHRKAVGDLREPHRESEP